jgi:bacillithiol biosynthesis deacetylase BshB1
VKVLALSPHPDDAELFCGGTLAAFARSAEVVIADLTRGEMSSNGTVELRQREADAAASALGVVRPRRQLGLPDAALDARDRTQVDGVVELMRAEGADLVLAPWPEDRHPDHVAAGRIARRAHALTGATARLLFYPCHAEIEPSLLVDVSDTIEQWEAAVRSYASQFLEAGGVPTPINRPGFVEQHRARRVRWGARRGVAFAEGLIFEGPWPVTAASLLEV